MATAIPQKYEHTARWAFGDTEQQADEVVQLILNGTKTATCSNLDGEGIPLAGDVFLVVNGKGDPVCSIELTTVKMKTYDQVDEAHAYAEGEGDRSLAHWRKELQRFFEKYDLFSPGMTLVLMNFKVIDTF